MKMVTGAGEIEAIRRELRGREPGPGRRYAPELRRRMVRWARARRAAGASLRGIAAELGLKGDTLRRWLGNERQDETVARVRALVPVHVVPAAPPTAVILISPSGFRVEGLGVQEAAALLRELG